MIYTFNDIKISKYISYLYIYYKLKNKKYITSYFLNKKILKLLSF